MTRTALRPFSRALTAALLFSLSALPAFAARYTYHGELMDGDAPAEGPFDVRVRAFATPDAKAALGEATELPGIAVKDGRMALQLELPENPRGNLYVEVAIRAAGTQDKYETLGAPQAVSKAAVGCWAVDGNSGLPPNSFLGIAENVATPLVLRARDTAVATFSPDGTAGAHGDAPRVALGSSANAAMAIGATVGGGGSTFTDAGAPCADCGNIASGLFASVSGGVGNLASGPNTTVAGGDGNTSSGNASTVSGGADNVATGSRSTVGGGGLNSATNFEAVVSGGRENTASGASSVVAGGEQNRAGGLGSVVAGGDSNIASGSFSATLGGSNHCAGGDYSVALGTFAYVRAGNEGEDVDCPNAPGSGDADGDEGSFVWADSPPPGMFTAFSTTGPNQFLIRSRGGVGINAAPVDARIELTVTSDPDDSDAASLWLKQRAAANAGMLLTAVGSELRIDHFDGTSQFARMELSDDGSAFIRSSATGGGTGVILPAGSGAWNPLSDRRLKTAIQAVDPIAILDRLVAMPMSTWSYTAQGEGVRHIGPMAQDFAAAFGVGENDTTISTIDADGVALVAIQGLNARLTAENAELRARLDALEARLEALD